ncbi:hypothetical protein LTR05_003132 [Lithohypha guttulata]|uniref:Uncharacterized protein n=1 Tax=Lithohypha guttulata TaxID=1690604 RepID=A0AAN7T665_9EURO|nr:hypothetical protein LTR05_003132 [Lithohypha guttulata]
MLVLRKQQLVKRHNPGTTFTIIFCVIAVCVLLACAIWGFILPQWRKKHPPQPSRTKWNEGSILTTRKSRRIGNAFPTHPAVKPLLSKPSTAQILPTYNPRVESPFPDQPEPGISRSRKEVEPRTYSAHTAPLPTVSSNGLFTPVRRGENSFHTIPQATDARHHIGKSSDFGDAKHFILAVPEPLTLRSRDTDRPPAVTRHLEKYGTPYPTSLTGSDKLPHPNKLFRAIQGSDTRNSFCSTTSLRVDHRESDAAAAWAAKEVVAALDEAIQEGKEQRKYSSDESSKLSHFIGQSHELPCATLSDLHRLYSYRSLTGSQPTKNIKAKSVLKLELPIHTLGRVHDREQGFTAIPMVSLPQASTTSTMLTTGENSSEIESISTPATSPIMPPSKSCVLPTALRPCNPNDTASISALGKIEHECNNTSTVLTQNKEGRLTEQRNSRGFYHPGRRTKPVPPSIHISSGSSPTYGRQQRRSLSDPSHNIVVPVKGKLRSQVRASSMYSRDTDGFSLTPLPITPDFPSPLVDIFADQDVSGNPSTFRESVRTRIYKWHQKIESSTATLTLPPSKQTSPMISVRSIAGHDGNDTAVGAVPEDSKNQVEMVGERSHPDCDHSAPGGAVWI